MENQNLPDVKFDIVLIFAHDTIAFPLHNTTFVLYTIT